MWPQNPGLEYVIRPVTSIITSQFKKKQCLSFLQNHLCKFPLGLLMRNGVQSRIATTRGQVGKYPANCLQVFISCQTMCFLTEILCNNGNILCKMRCTAETLIPNLADKSCIVEYLHRNTKVKSTCVGKLYQIWYGKMCYEL